MRKSILLFFVLIMSISLSVAQTAMQNVMSRSCESLNGEWNILLDPFANGVRAKWYDPQPASDKSKLSEIYYEGDLTLDVPGDWNSQLRELFYYEGNIWYQRNFTYASKEGRKAILHFGAVSMHCNVYLNGEEIGSHRGGFTPFQFDVTDKLKEGGNLLVVRVDNLRSENTIPTLNFDWWNYGGITRDVNLVSVPNSYLYDYTIGLHKNHKDKLFVDVQLKGDDIVGREVEVSISEAGLKLKLKTNRKGYASVTKRVDFELWSPSNPKMYDVEIASADEVIKDKIGFRTVEVKGEDILLNGEPIFLRGINIHEEIASQSRRSYNAKDAEFLINEAIELGCNFIRLSHYPHNEYMVRLAEQKGMLMWEEIPVWQAINFENQEVCNYAEGMMSEMISRDKNRCGIIMWSVSNETPLSSAARCKFLKHLALKSKKADPTRLVTSALDGVYPEKDGDSYYMRSVDPLIDVLDVVGLNKYMGWYAMFPCAPEDLIWDVADGKPVIISEFGAECVAGNREGDGENLNSWSEEYMGQTYRDNLASFNDFPNLRGTSPWILFDFRSPRRPHAKFQQGWNRKGIISPDGVRKDAWYIMRDFYNTKK